MGPAQSDPFTRANRFRALNGLLDHEDVPSPPTDNTSTPPPVHSPPTSCLSKPLYVNTHQSLSARRSASPPLSKKSIQFLPPPIGTSSSPIDHLPPRSASSQRPLDQPSFVGPPFGPSPSRPASSQRPLDRLASFRSLLPQGFPKNPASLVAIFSLAGETDHPLLRFAGTLFGRPATFLVDSGATNDFVSTSFVKQHALLLVPNGRTVRAFDGTVSSSAGELRASLVLSSDLGLLPDSRVTRPFTAVQLKGEDAILGQPWLRSINPTICWATGDVRITRRPSSSPSDPELTYSLSPAPAQLPSTGAGHKVLDLIESLCALYSESNQRNNPTTDGRLAQLLAATVPKGPPPSPQLDALRAAFFKEYADVFPDALPDGLPPARSIDHKIELKPGSTPPNRTGIRYSRADDEGIAAYVEENL